MRTAEVRCKLRLRSRSGPRIDHSNARLDKLADVPRDDGQAMVRGGRGDQYIRM